MLRVIRPTSWCRVHKRLQVKQWEANVNQACNRTSTVLLHARPIRLRIVTTCLSHARLYCTNNNQFSTTRYEQMADETLDSLTELFEDLPERLTCDPQYDVTFGSGVLTVCISQEWGTYVINKQVPNKQIWLSSPISGPKRYDFIDGVWLYKYEGQTLHDLLTVEISEALGEQIDFTQCSYGKT